MLIQILLKDLILPVIVTLLSASGIWLFIRAIVSGKDRASAQLDLAKVDAQRAQTQITLYTNAMNLVQTLEKRLEETRQREERLDRELQQLKEAHFEAHQKIQELQGKLHQEVNMRMRLEVELERAKRELEDRGAPHRRDGPPH